MDNLILLNENELAQMCDLLDELLKNDTDSLKRRIDFLKIIHILNCGKRVAYTDNTVNMSDETLCALQFMDEHLIEDVSIKEIADACNVSLSTLERKFKEIFNASPFMVLRNKRLIVSMEYLRGGDSVSEAAYKSGFSDYSNYIHLFKKQFGIPNSLSDTYYLYQAKKPWMRFLHLTSMWEML